MNSRMNPSPETQNPADIAAWLRAHPTFLADDPSLYRVLAPPVRVHGEPLADHMTAMIRAERAHAARLAEEAARTVAARRAAAGLAGRVEAAVLALLRTSDPIECVTQEFPGLLAIDAAAICVEQLWPRGAHALPMGGVGALLAGRDVVFRDCPEDAAVLHAEAADLARRDALVRLPGQGPAALLALVSRDPAHLDERQGASPLAFLGRAVATALGR